MYGMKMQNDDGTTREATTGEKVLLAPVVVILLAACWCIKIGAGRKRN